MSRFDPEKVYYYHNMVNSTEQIITMFDFFSDSKPESDDTEEDFSKFCRDHYGVFLDEDGEEHLIRNSAMLQLCELHSFIQQQRKESEDARRRDQAAIRDLERKLKRAKEYASMSDERIADELQKEIDYYEKEAGEEGLVYGPVELMEYCRDRLRNTRTR